TWTRLTLLAPAHTIAGDDEGLDRSLVRDGSPCGGRARGLRRRFGGGGARARPDRLHPRRRALRDRRRRYAPAPARGRRRGPCLVAGRDAARLCVELRRYLRPARAHARWAVATPGPASIGPG